MAEDRKPSPDDSQDHGVLDDVGTSTTSIDLGATAQVSVTLPVGYRDDDSDDDVIADELTDEEAARAGAIGERPTDGETPTDDGPEDDEAEDAAAEMVEAAADVSDATTDDVDDNDADNREGAEDSGPAADDVAGTSDADAGDEDAGGPDAADPDAEARADDDPDAEFDGSVDEDTDADPDDTDADPEDATAAAGDDEDDTADDATDDENDTVAAADAGDDESGADLDDDSDDLDDGDSDDEDSDDDSGDEDSDDDNSGDDPGDGNSAAEDADDDNSDDEDSDDSGEHDVEPFEIADPVGDEPDEPRSLTKAPADDLLPVAEAAGDDREGEPDPAAPETTPREETPVSQPDRPERVSFLRPPARRVDEVEDAANRESSDVLTDERLLDTGAIRRPEPEDPWRRIIYSATGGLINLGDSKKTRARKALMARIAAPLPGAARFVPVMSRKGGVGKTTVTALLGMALADARNDRVVAIDANPDRGTLAERIAKISGKTVRDVVRDRDEIHGYGDLSAHVVRDETRLDVLASDADPHVADAFSDADYRKVSELAQHFYSLVLTDTGTGIVHSVMNATLDLADQIVIVSGTSVDEARLASETLTWLETNGHSELANNAVVVINQEASGTELVRLDELESHFRTRARAVVRIPYDARIATGSTITFHDLAPATRQAARTLASLVVEGIRSA